ncbi:MAG: ATP-binding cassette domain-containing protein [Candidatus Korobacteraceae bacterium]
MSDESPRVDTLTARLRKSFRGETGLAFRLDVEFIVAAGFTILFGASGAGKTTLLDCIAGLQAPDEGTIAVGESVLFDSKSRVNLPPNRRAVAYLVQSLALFPHMTVEQNVQYGLATLSPTERDARSGEVLESFRISSLVARRPAEISAGERQRVALARALVTRPRVLLLDEPLTALDAVTKARILDDLRAWNRQHQIPILYVTHDRAEVFALGASAIALHEGSIIARGSPHEVLQRPQSETVAQLVGFENIFDCSVISSHPEYGTMTCRIAGSALDLEVPLTRLNASLPLRVGIRGGDILLASSQPQGLSARNILNGIITSLEQRDLKVIAVVASGPVFEVHLTLGARDALQLKPGDCVWLVIKTYSCHVLQGSS